MQYLQGRAELVDAHNLRVKLSAGGEETVQFEHAMLATGSLPAIPPALKVDDPRVMDSTAALDLPDIPEVAARRRRRLHRPRARDRVRGARQRRDGRRDDRTGCCPAPTAISSTCSPSASARR